MRRRTRTRRTRRPTPQPAARPLVPQTGGPQSLLPDASGLAPTPLLAPLEPTVVTTEPAPLAEVPLTGGEAAPAEAVAAPEVGELAPVEAPAPAPVELIIPPPPPDMESRARGGARRASNNMESAGTANRDLPPAGSNTQAARENVQEPVAETAARAQSGLTQALRERPAPSPEIEELCADIQDAIENRRPVDEDSLRRTDPEAEAQAVGDRLNGDISEDSARVQGEYDQVNTPPAGEAVQNSAPIPETPRSVAAPGINASGATPAAVLAEDVSLDADLAASQNSVADAGMTSPAANEITTGPVAEARSGLGELETTAAVAPAEVLRQQEEAIASSRSAMRETQNNALTILERSRAATVEDTAGQQLAMVGSETQQREAASAAAEAIFTQAQTDVNDLLRPLVPTAMERWNTGKERIAGEFDRELQRAKDMVDERHSGIDGAIISIWDDVTGLPSSITRIYDGAERTFGRDICTLIREVSTYVNGVIIACEEIIDNADTRIQAIFDALPAELQEWAQGQQEGFQGRLDGLRDNVHTTQQDFTNDLVNQAANAVQEARERIDALREAAKGLIQKVADAVDAFLEDPVRAIINGLLTLVGIAPAAFWSLIARIEQVATDIADDPMNFANNLMRGIGQGFQLFFDNFFSNLLGGFINWLFSAMGTVGVEIPQDTSLKSIITFMLQLMGITWPRIREILVRHIGEENVELLEQAYEILNLLIEQGPSGIFEMIKEELDPRNILNTIIESAVSFMVEKIVAVATVRIIGLFNPVGAIAQAIEAIYKVLRWIFQNAARIFQLVETVVNGMADIIAGNIAGMADKTHQALRGMLVPVIDFIAGFLSLGDLPEKIAEVVGGFQEMVLAGIDRVVGFLVAQARSVLAAIGLGGDGDDPNGGGDGPSDDEVGDRIRFSGGGESHSMWIDATGNNKIMVASRPETLDAKLNRWNREKAGLADDKKAEAESLLTQVAEQEGIILREAEESEQAIEQAKNNPEDSAAQATAQQQDTEVENEQREMSPQLGRLFDIFEGGVPFDAIELPVNLSTMRFELSIDKGFEHRLEPRIFGEPLMAKMATITRGPAFNTQHRAGRTLLQSIIRTISPKGIEIRRIGVSNDRIISTDLQRARSLGREILAELEKMQAFKAHSLAHLQQPPPHRIQRHTVVFTPSYTDQVILREYDRQLRLQQDGLNQMLVDQWVVNRNSYTFNAANFDRLDQDKRQALLSELKRRATFADSRAQARTTKYREAIVAIDEAIGKIDDLSFRPSIGKIKAVTGRFGNESTWRNQHRDEMGVIIADLERDMAGWTAALGTRTAVLHNADQIAGGFGFIPPISVLQAPPASAVDAPEWRAYLDSLKQYVGSSRVNSSIGSLWAKRPANHQETRIESVDNHVRSNYPSEGWGIWQMNVHLTR
ncbi:MAG: polymorphic toxin type 15 domain-containing protein [Bacteroidota bacterium]